MEEQELNLRETFLRAQYLEATHREGSQGTTPKGASPTQPTLLRTVELTEEPGTQQGKRPITDHIVCFKCNKPGHYARDCPDKTTYGNREDTGGHTSKLVRQGQINGYPANRIHLDTESSMTLAHSRFVRTAAHLRSVEMRNTTGTQTYPTIELDGLNHIKEVAVSDLLEDALLGTNVSLWPHLVKSLDIKERERIKEMIDNETVG